MEDLSVKVLRAYDIKNARIFKEKGAYRIQLKTESYLIRKANQTAKRIQFQHEIKENLYESGFKNIDRFYFSAQEQPYFQLDDDIYTMTDYINYPEACFSNNAELTNILETTAKMHSLLRMSAGVICDEFKSGGASVSEYEKSFARIKKIKSGLNIEKRLSDIDVMFLKNYGHYTERAAESISRLKAGGFDEYINQAAQKGFVQHNNLKEENIFINGNKVYITNFSECSAGCCLLDLENIIRRYMKNLPEDFLSVDEIVDIYNIHNALDDNEIEILRALLVYPQKFIRVISQYYNKKHAFIPGSIYSRMCAEIENKEVYGKYLAGI